MNQNKRFLKLKQQLFLLCNMSVQFFIILKARVILCYIRFLSHTELSPLRAPLVPMEHCTTSFFEQCDADKDKYIALEEWANCFGIKEREFLTMQFILYFFNVQFILFANFGCFLLSEDVDTDLVIWARLPLTLPRYYWGEVLTLKLKSN